MIDIQLANEDDLPAVQALLAKCGLPAEGLSEHLATMMVARSDEGVVGIVGSAALELYGEAALLRSVAVDEALRGQGLGVEMTRAALNLARSQGVSEVYLLTETAADFFTRFGFRRIARGEVPATVQVSAEFNGGSPDTAQAMLAEIVVWTG